ncbi:aspartate dehydrogenase [Sphingobium sp.]|uniref:aspartate dehydrogenase n=1 Tax=Sphingobium sp. TaxID=1912891 RepID=UPI0035C6FC5F
MAEREPIRIAFIGDGGISRSVRETLTDSGVPFVTSAILSHQLDGEVIEQGVDTLDKLLDSKPDLVVECAGHGAILAYAMDILAAGVPLMIVSIGSLADTALLDRLRKAAETGNSRIILAAGAMAGIDALAAAKLGGLSRVVYRGRKPALAWRGTPAEALIDLESLDAPRVFYQGSAREAALAYPKNSNVAATIALAGIGFDRTEVELVADPTIDKNIHELMFEGEDGRFEINICGAPSKANPKTSALTAHSIARLIAGMASPIVI